MAWVRRRREIDQGRMGISLSSPAIPYSLKLSSGLLGLSRQDLLNVPYNGYLQIGDILGIILNLKSGSLHKIAHSQGLFILRKCH